MMEDIPEDMRDVFVTAMDLLLAVTYRGYRQCGTDRIGNAISKTVNMPASASCGRRKGRLYFMAHKKGLKGITVYRDGSRHEQVMHAGKMERQVLPNVVVRLRCPVDALYVLRADASVLRSQLV